MNNNQEILEAYSLIKSKKFDNALSSDTPFYEWDGKSLVDFNDIIRLKSSYKFDEMEPKSGVWKNFGGDDIKSYIKLKKVWRVLPRVLFIVFIAFIIILIMFFQNKISNMSFYMFLALFYLININLPATIRKKLRKNKYINLS